MSYAKRIQNRAEKTGDAWQAVLDVFYKDWQENKFTSYGEMISVAEKENPRFALCILLGKLNYQVNNGGFIQYFDNGYASSRERTEDVEDFDLLEKTVKLAREFLGGDFPEICTLLEEVYDSIDYSYETCQYCSGSGSYYDEDEEVTCDDCDGDGEIKTDEVGLDDYLANRFDSRYYDLDVEDKVSPFLEDIIMGL